MTDPGTAQVFIKEGLKPGLENVVCIQTTCPWTGGVDIPDNAHSKVTILINGDPVAEAQINNNQTGIL